MRQAIYTENRGIFYEGMVFVYSRERLLFCDYGGQAMRYVKVVALFAIVAVPSLFNSAYAHHSGAPYDSTKKITLEGVVREWSWRNPHSSLRLAVTQANGGETVWIIEGTSPNILIKQGWKRTSIKPGDRIKATIHPLRDGKPGGSLLGVVTSEGKVLGAPPGSGGVSSTPQKTSAY